MRSGDPDSTEEPRRDGVGRLTRRRFLILAGATLGSGLLAACMGDDDDAATPTLVGATRTPDSAIETPQVGESPGPSPTADEAASSELERFMALSRALTGFDELNDTELGQVYLDAVIASDDLEDQLDQLYDKAGMADDATDVTLESLESTGAFDDDTRPVADAITTAWYTGVYDAGDGESVVATYINALAWHATEYRRTGPSSCSGATGNWSAAPAA